MKKNHILLLSFFMSGLPLSTVLAAEKPDASFPEIIVTANKVEENSCGMEIDGLVNITNVWSVNGSLGLIPRGI